MSCTLPEAAGQLLFDAVKPRLIGKTFCGSAFTQETHLDAVETNPSAQVFAVRGSIRRAARHLSIPPYSPKSGALSMTVISWTASAFLRVLPNSLAVSYSRGLVAYEAIYFDSANDGKSIPANRRGVFIEDRFLLDLDPQKASSSRERNRPDFWFGFLSDRLEVRPEVRMAAGSGER
jgi:hypothetical protein